MKLNCLGEACPLPVIKAKKALSEIEDGVVSVLVDNIEAVENIEKMVRGMGFAHTSRELDGNYEITITKGKGGLAGGDAAEPNEIKGRSPVVVISSDKMGEGDDELGGALLKTFIYTLTELDETPEAVIFYNGGVKMTAEGSLSISDIKVLQKKGADILSCGACLKYYELLDALKVGRVSNMYEIAGMLMNASSVIKP